MAMTSTWFWGMMMWIITVRDPTGRSFPSPKQNPLTQPTAKDPGHPVYNAIPGRYANRIGKGKYTIDGEEYHTELNDGNNTLHSGTNNWSYRVWNVTEHTPTSITFAISDASNSSLGMLGRVDSTVTYSVSKNTWHIKMNAVSPERKTRK